MPHFVIEYSNDLEEQYKIEQVMLLAREAGVKSGVMLADDIKVRARGYDHYSLLEADDSFVHVTVFMLAGRTDAQKLKLSELLREKLQDYLVRITSISIDIRDMDPHAYKKRLLPQKN